MNQVTLPRVLSVMAALFLMAAGVQAGEQGERKYAGRPLAEALRDLQNRGLRLIFSSDLVRPEMRVKSEPRAGTPRRILDELLAPHGLEARNGPGGSVLVVKTARALRKSAAAAAGQGGMRLHVRSESDQQPLAALRVRVAGMEAKGRTDRDGTLLIPRVPTGTYVLQAILPGFAERQLEGVAVSAGQVVDVDLALAPAAAGARVTDASELKVLLLERARFEETVEVSAQTEAAEVGPEPLPVKPIEVAALAGGGENVFRTLQTLPGVAATDEFGGRVAVRGGSPDQNLTLMDGVEIHNPLRLFVAPGLLGAVGLASAFNPETVDSFEFSTGAFSLRYGDRLSSLLIIHNRDGDPSRRFHGSSALSLTDANLVLEGKLARNESGSWLLTGRRTYYDLVLNHLLKDDLPSFGDLQGRLNWRPRAGQSLSLFGSWGREGTHYGNLAQGDEVMLVADARNELAAARFDSSLGSRGSSRTVLSYTRLADSLDADTRSFSNSRGANVDSVSISAPLQFQFARTVSVRDVALREELSLRPSDRSALDVGVEAHRLKTRWSSAVGGDRNQREANGSSIRIGLGLPDFLDSSVGSTRLGGWLEGRWQATARLAVEGGLRADRSTVNAQTTVSPRLASTLRLGESTRLRAAVRLHTQSPGYEKLFQADYFVDLDPERRRGLSSERAWHAVLGLERDLAPGLLLRLEGYHKDFADLIVGRLESEAERQARLASYDVPASLLDAVPTRPQITTVPVNGATGRARGFEIYLARRPTSAATRLTGWASYTFGTANRSAYGRTYPFDYDRRHALSVVANWRSSPRLELSTTTRWATGFPRTPVRGVRLALARDTEDRDGDGNRQESLPLRDEAGRFIFQPDLGDVSNLNSARMPHFARLDARLTYRPRGAAGRWAFYLDVINVLNRKNAVLIDSALVFAPGSDRPRIVEEREDIHVPLLPSLGVHFRF